MDKLTLLLLLGVVSAFNHVDQPSVECPFGHHHPVHHHKHHHHKAGDFHHKHAWSWGMVDLAKGKNETFEQHESHAPLKSFFERLMGWDLHPELHKETDEHHDCPFMTSMMNMADLLPKFHNEK